MNWSAAEKLYFLGKGCILPSGCPSSARLSVESRPRKAPARSSAYLLGRALFLMLSPGPAKSAVAAVGVPVGATFVQLSRMGLLVFWVFDRGFEGVLGRVSRPFSP